MNKIFRFFVPLIVALVLLGILIWLAGASSRAVADPLPSSPQGAILVDTLEDELNSDGDCSLREAITAANDNTVVDACPAGDAVITDTITFDVAGIITVTSQLVVTAGGPLVIDGGDEITISGGDSVRIFYVNALTDLSLERLALVYGHANIGGGIYNDGRLTITNSTLSDNSAGEGGGIINYATLTITNSTLSGNSSTNGGGIFNDGRLTITNSTLSGNSSTNGGGIHNGYYATLTITNSTLSGNSAGEGGGGIFNERRLTITNSTLSDNSAGEGGGIFNGYYATLTITNSTLSGNSSTNGGGIFNEGSLTIANSIIGNSPSGGNCVGDPITDAGHNIEDTNACGFDPANGSMPNTDPLLAPLGANGGPTWTHALLPDSPAIDTADPANCPPTDQRGFPRPVDGDRDGASICDIGSCELVHTIYLSIVVR